jgi:predicted MFS family arabinose efflux permease
MPDGLTVPDQLPAPRRPGSLLRNPDFVSLWAGQSVSMAGSAVSFIGLPLVAVLVLHVSAVQLSLISAVDLLPPVVVGPFIGPVADRYSRHRLMLVAGIGSAAVLAIIPVAYLTGVLSLWLMVLAAFVTGVLTSLFNVAFQAFLPSIVAASQLGDGNAKLSASQSASGIFGPGLAAGLIALGGPATAVAADAFSYLVSAYALIRIRTRDPGHDRVRSGGVRAFWRDIQTGFGLLRCDVILRTVTRSNAIMACFGQLQSAVYFLFLTKDLHFGASTISVIFLAAGLLGLLSALGCSRLAGRLGFGPLIITGQLTMALGGTFLALAQGSRLDAAAFITAGEACFEVGMTLFGVGYVTLFQLRAADEVRGAIIGAAKFTTAASTPFAALLAGVLGEAFGLRAALIVGAIGMALGLVSVLSPRVWRLGVSPQVIGPS